MISPNLSAKGRHAWITLILTIVAGLICSCVSYPSIQSERPFPAETDDTNPALGRSENGGDPDEMSLWADNTIMVDLFSDTKARRIGDIVTIQVSESSSAENSASTDTDRESSLSAGIQEFFGAEVDTLDNFNVQGGIESEFQGSGSTTRRGNLEAFITARVVEVLPGGNLKVIGSREILVNNEKQLMTIYGVVRPRDISKDNVVLSSFVSDARIAYSGAGIVDDRQRPGWMANTLNTIWPF